jgi:hypothetical protein
MFQTLHTNPDMPAYWGAAVRDCLLCLAQQPRHECAELWTENAYRHARHAARLAIQAGQRARDDAPEVTK